MQATVKINNQQICEVSLPIFEGPMDLLLYFIQRDKINVYDIPIAKITKEFLDYLQFLRESHLEVGAEFIQMAALLIKIKTKLLIPQVQRTIEKNPEEDPRRELTQKIIEYQKFKAISEELEKLIELNKNYIPLQHSDYLKKYLLPPEEIYSYSVSPYMLLKTFVRLMKNLEKREYKHPKIMKPFNYTLPQLKEWIQKTLLLGEKYSFLSLLEYEPNKQFAIVLFLATLEMIQLRVIKLYFAEGAEDFYISLN